MHISGENQRFKEAYKTQLELTDRHMVTESRGEGSKSDFGIQGAIKANSAEDYNINSTSQVLKSNHSLVTFNNSLADNIDQARYNEVHQANFSSNSSKACCIKSQSLPRRTTGTSFTPYTKMEPKSTRISTRRLQARLFK